MYVLNHLKLYNTKLIVNLTRNYYDITFHSGNDHAFFPKIRFASFFYLKEVSLTEQRDSEQWLGYQSSIAELVHPGAES